jgi:hypothetical protein
LVSQQSVFRQQFGFASGQIIERSKRKGGRWWFDPMYNGFLKRMQVETDALLERRTYRQLECNLFCLKIVVWSEYTRRVDRMDCTRILHDLARKLAPSCRTGPNIPNGCSE